MLNAVIFIVIISRIDIVVIVSDVGDDPGMCISCYNRAFDAETSKSPDERLGAAVTFSLPINQSTIGTLAIVCLSRIYTVFNDIIVNRSSA